MPPHVNHIAATASSFHNASQSPLLQLLPLLPALQLLTLPRLPPAQPLSPLWPLLLLPLLPPLLLLPQLTLAMGICCAGPVACQAPTEVAQTAAALAKNALACVPARPVSGRWHDLALPLLGAALAGADLRATRRMAWDRARRATRGMPRPFVGMDAGRRHEAAAERSFRGEAVTGRGPTRRNQSPAACSRREKLTGQARTGVEPALVVGRAQLLRAGPGIHHDVGTCEVPRLP